MTIIITKLVVCCIKGDIFHSIVVEYIFRIFPLHYWSPPHQYTRPFVAEYVYLAQIISFIRVVQYFWKIYLQYKENKRGRTMCILICDVIYKNDRTLSQNKVSIPIKCLFDLLLIATANVHVSLLL